MPGERRIGRVLMKISDMAMVGLYLSCWALGVYLTLFPIDASKLSAPQGYAIPSDINMLGPYALVLMSSISVIMLMLAYAFKRGWWGTKA
jgi:hypothetical protein